MKTLSIIITLFFLGFNVQAQDDNCNSVVDGWKSEKQAIAIIQEADFETSDSISPYNSNWMNSAHFYSCSPESGYLIVKSDKKTYVHQEVPKAIWSSLKKAKSVGGFYNFYIKDNYKLDKRNSI